MGVCVCESVVLHENKFLVLIHRLGFLSSSSSSFLWLLLQRLCISTPSLKRKRQEYQQQQHKRQQQQHNKKPLAKVRQKEESFVAQNLFLEFIHAFAELCATAASERERKSRSHNVASEPAI